MSIIDIGILSGFVPDKQSLQKVNIVLLYLHYFGLFSLMLMSMLLLLLLLLRCRVVCVLLAVFPLLVEGFNTCCCFLKVRRNFT